MLELVGGQVDPVAVSLREARAPIDGNATDEGLCERVENTPERVVVAAECAGGDDRLVDGLGDYTTARFSTGCGLTSMKMR